MKTAILTGASSGPVSYTHLLRLAEAAQQGAHEIVGGPDPPRQVIGGAGTGDVAAVDLHRVGVEAVSYTHLCV